MFGVLTEDCWGALDLRTGAASLFVPRLPADYAVWMGPIASLDQVRAMHGVDEAAYVDQIAEVLGELAPPSVHVLEGCNTDSGLRLERPTFAGCEAFTFESDALHRVLVEARVRKTSLEVEIMRYAAAAASQGHVAALRACSSGGYEFQMESAFLHDIYSSGGCRIAPYTPIFGSGPNAAVLHYGHAGSPNDRQMRQGDWVLVDAGAEYYRYASDITTCFPVGGRFTDKHRVVYEAVLAASRAVLQAAKPGVAWPDMHILAERTMLAKLAEAGLVRGDLDAAVAARVGGVFQPHGLGHLLGIEVHDVGGYGPGLPPRPEGAGIASLRLARVLEQGMVLTVEPGCYFVDHVLERAFDDPLLAQFLVPEEINKFRGLGGVRIEDDCLVTATGLESFNNVPRDIQDIEEVMAGGAWPKQQ